jgi:hypothetical protein
MLAGLVAARLLGGSEVHERGRDLFAGAVASSLLVEAPGLAGVPSLAATRERAIRSGFTRASGTR